MGKIYDISMPISKDMVLWPDDPGVSLERTDKLEDGAISNVTKMDFGLHTGTHIDAPYHFLEKGITVDKIPLTKLIGATFVVEVPNSVTYLDGFILESMGLDFSIKRILFKTNNSDLLMNSNTFNDNYVALDDSGAEYLVENGVELVGIDYLSIASINKIESVHKRLLNAGIVILEGINLFEIKEGVYQMYCLPLSLIGVEASPTRVILMD